MNDMLLFCDSDVALRCPEVEMAQIIQGLFDLFSGTASAHENADSEGDDFVGDAPNLAALGRFQPNVEGTSEGVSRIYL